MTCLYPKTQLTRKFLQKARVTEQDINAVIIAGAFGTFRDVQSGIDIGMFPKLG
ncbi:MAG: ASKHA domain-containing protein [Chloroflexi bacterium]|nr:ASKHA domain-containing protein [Chloroflexota bacterium]